MNISVTDTQTATIPISPITTSPHHEHLHVRRNSSFKRLIKLPLWGSAGMI